MNMSITLYKNICYIWFICDKMQTWKIISWLKDNFEKHDQQVRDLIDAIFCYTK